MPDVYALAWKLLEKQIAKSRRQSISKADLVEWQLHALEKAIDILAAPTPFLSPDIKALRRYAFGEEEVEDQGHYPPGSFPEQVQHGKQEEA
jgi:hypothetical protein